uniref:hypothetical protein n=1 Tax=Epilithonimonas hominis TaxID=420404 RepID=UPI0028970CA1
MYDSKNTNDEKKFIAPERLTQKHCKYTALNIIRQIIKQNSKFCIWYLMSHETIISDQSQTLGRKIKMITLVNV